MWDQATLDPAWCGLRRDHYISSSQRDRGASWLRAHRHGMASLISCGGQRALTTAMASGLWRHEDCSMHPNGAMYVLPRISSPCHHSFSSPASPAHLRRRSASLHPPLRHLLRSATSPHQHFRFAASYLAASASRSTSSLQVLASPPALPQQYFFKACSLFFSSFFSRLRFLVYPCRKSSDLFFSLFFSAPCSHKFCPLCKFCAHSHPPVIF
mmetsp:Transcript_23670/g.53829  ORF Transcript_23670/g.53829 Transcript_23670/m.53829 type:complete len:212 (+) Transcript_23670:365-1000(+)